MNREVGESSEFVVDGGGPERPVAGYPPPRYDSGWIAIAPGSTIRLCHGVAGDVSRYHVVLQARQEGGLGIHNRAVGADTSLFHQQGVHYSQLMPHSVCITRLPNDSWADFVRVLIWTWSASRDSVAHARSERVAACPGGTQTLEGPASLVGLRSGLLDLDSVL